MLTASDLAPEFLAALHVEFVKIGRGKRLEGEAQLQNVSMVTQHHELEDLKLPIKDFVLRFIEPSAAVLAKHISDRCPVGAPICFEKFRDGQGPPEQIAVCFGRTLGLSVRIAVVWVPQSFGGQLEGWYSRYDVAWRRPEGSTC